MKYYVSYREEFGATVEAKDEEEAKKKFERNEAKIECICNLWPDYLEVEDEEVHSAEVS